MSFVKYFNNTGSYIFFRNYNKYCFLHFSYLGVLYLNLLLIVFQKMSLVIGLDELSGEDPMSGEDQMTGQDQMAGMTLD